MSRQSWIAVFITLLVGFIIQGMINNWYSNYRDLSVKIGSALGAAFGFAIAVLALPFILAIIRKLTKKSFPNDAFIVLTYSILVLWTLLFYNAFLR